MTLRIKKWLAAIRYVFYFRKPDILELNCIDLVAENKLVFLVAWDTKGAGRVTIYPARRTFKSSMGAALVTLPPATQCVEIVIRNFWRRSTASIQLRHIKLDQQTLSCLLSDLRLSTGITVERVSPVDCSVPQSLNFTMPQIKRSIFQTYKTPSLNYSNLRYHEP